MACSRLSKNVHKISCQKRKRFMETLREIYWQYVQMNGALKWLEQKRFSVDLTVIIRNIFLEAYIKRESS